MANVSTRDLVVDLLRNAGDVGLTVQEAFDLSELSKSTIANHFRAIVASDQFDVTVTTEEKVGRGRKPLRYVLTAMREAAA